MKIKDALVSILTAMVVSAGTALALNPPFSTVWNSGYEAIPADTEQESLGASRIRDLKQQLRLRLSQDHSWNGDGNDGYHKQVTLLQQAQTPIPSFDAGATGGSLFTESVNGNDELLWADNNGHTTQLTASGGTPQVVPPGTISYFAGPTTPSGYLLANGQAVSRTTYGNLFANIGTQYGNGDGTSTFNLPDCRARFVAGGDATNATGRLTGLTGGLSASTLGNTGGGQQFALVAGNIPQLPVTIHDPGHTHPLNNTYAVNNTNGQGAATGGSLVAANAGSTVTGSAFTGITANANEGNAVTNVTAAIPPSIVFNCIVKTKLEPKDDPQNFLPDTYAQADGGDSQRPEPTLPGFGGLWERYTIIPPETRFS